MKVREQKGGRISIFGDFLTHQKCIFHQFSKINEKQQQQLETDGQLFTSLTRCIILQRCVMWLFQRSPGTCKIMRRATDGIKLLFTNFQCTQIYMFLLDCP